MELAEDSQAHQAASGHAQPVATVKGTFPVEQARASDVCAPTGARIRVRQGRTASVDDDTWGSQCAHHDGPKERVRGER